MRAVTITFPVKRQTWEIQSYHLIESPTTSASAISKLITNAPNAV